MKEIKFIGELTAGISGNGLKVSGMDGTGEYYVITFNEDEKKYLKRILDWKTIEGVYNSKGECDF